MNKITTLLTIVIASLSLVLLTTMQSKAQNKTPGKAFAGVVPFVTNNDRLGFLDQNNGRIYIYDNNVSQCLYVGQIKELGQPINAIATSNLNTTNPATL